MLPASTGCAARSLAKASCFCISNLGTDALVLLVQRLQPKENRPVARAQVERESRQGVHERASTADAEAGGKKRAPEEPYQGVCQPGRLQRAHLHPASGPQVVFREVGRSDYTNAETIQTSM